MMAALRKNAVWWALLLTLAACAWFKWQELTGEKQTAAAISAITRSATLMPVKPLRPRTSAAALAANEAHVLLRPPAGQAPAENLFSVYQPLQTNSNAQAAAAPQAPANPYSYAGELIEAGNIKVFLTDGTHNHAVQAGDVLDGGWRVQTINTAAVNLMYLPLKMMVTLPKGALN